MADASKTSFDAFGKTVSIENDLHLRSGNRVVQLPHFGRPQWLYGLQNSLKPGE